jgi:hypothetical protein
MILPIVERRVPRRAEYEDIDIDRLFRILPVDIHIAETVAIAGNLEKDRVRCRY